MFCVNIIDNIDRESPEYFPDSVAKQICDLIKINIKYENRNGEYSSAEIFQLANNKKSSLIQKRLEKGLAVYLTDVNDRIGGCGMIQYKETHYEAKTLHIHQDFRGQGYGRLICELRENILRDHGVPFLLTESLKFPKTLDFHQSRGFLPFEDGKTRRLTQLMRKELLQQ